MEASYTYLFIREDLSREQQIIQTAHAIHKMALSQDDKSLIPNAVLIGAKTGRDLVDICQYLEYNSIPFEMFWEPDINEYTAIATYPLNGNKRTKLRHFQLLRFGQNEFVLAGIAPWVFTVLIAPMAWIFTQVNIYPPVMHDPTMMFIWGPVFVIWTWALCNVGIVIVDF